MSMRFYFQFRISLLIFVASSFLFPQNVLAENHFYPSKLETIVKDLSSQCKDRERGAPYGIIVNALSPFWTATAIGGQVAATELKVATSFQAPVRFADPDVQKSYLQSMIDGKYGGISLSPIDNDKLKSTLKKAREAGVKIIAIDSDLPSGDRSVYVGTDNYKAGFEAGKTMVKALGKDGGKVVATVGNIIASNATERIRGIKDAIKDTKVELVSVLVDQNDLEKSEANARLAIQTYPDLKGMITVYSFNGPAALRALKEAKKLRKVKLVAFDLADETLEGLKDGSVTAAVGQRPYYWGRLSIYILHALNVLGPEATLKILSPYLEGPNHDVLDTQIDIVTPATVGEYIKYLNSLGIKQQ